MIANSAFIGSTLILVTALALSFQVTLRPKPVVVKTNLEMLPMEIAGYLATEDTFDQNVYRELNADKHVYRHYRDRDGNQVDLYIGYYGTAKGGRTGHNPYACLPGAGWAVVENKKVEVTPSYYRQPTAVNYVLAKKDGNMTLMLHWYQSSGARVLATGLQQNVQRFMGRVFHNRNDGAFVRVSAITIDQEAATKQRLVAFASNVLELLPSYWPNEE